ncbi:hypothetical protein [Oricola sp.]|uniref:hypothetical protein n=1 Tax=Oricola sp. TaxID=1979950 RepID=UPI0025D807E9|nr:hypothetical protein [Oricola sp.]MCI5078578.1 hypothetical protein [Oricola sp.]
MAKVKRIEPVTHDNHASIGSSLDWGLDAAAILGPIENIVPTFANEDVGDCLLLIELHDGRKALVAGFEREFRAVLVLDIAAETAISGAGTRRVRGGYASRSRQREEREMINRLPRSPFSDPPGGGERVVRQEEPPRFGKRRTPTVR